MIRSTSYLATLLLLGGCAAAPDQVGAIPGERHNLAVAAADAELPSSSASTINGQAVFNGQNTFTDGTTVNGNLSFTGPVSLTGPVALATDAGPGGGPATLPAGPSATAFLKLDGIDGESTAKDHAKEIDLLSFSWGVSQVGTTTTGGGGGVGKAKFGDIVVTKQVDKTTPVLMQACATGKHIKTAVIHVQRSGASQPYTEVTLTDILVTGVATAKGDMAAGCCTEQLTFNFAKIQWKMTQFSPTGAVLGTTFGGYDVKANRTAYRAF